MAHVVPGLATHSLLSVVHLFNAGCKVNFTKVHCIVRYRGQEVLRGQKCTRTGLWMVNLRGWEAPMVIAKEHLAAIARTARAIPRPIAPQLPVGDPTYGLATTLVTQPDSDTEIMASLVRTTSPTELA